MTSSSLPTFPSEEYQARWKRLETEISSRNADTAVIWQRSGGSYDRAGDLLWLCNYASLASGQEPSEGDLGVGRAFAAMIFRSGQEPELHISEPVALIDTDGIAVETIVSHDNLPRGIGMRLKELGVEGDVLHNADDFLPAMFVRFLDEAAPGIRWVPAADLLFEPHRIKSPLEQEVMREAGAVATNALTALMEGLIAGQPEATAAAAAAAEIVKAGGGFQRIGVHHGPGSESVAWSSGFYGFTTDAPQPGELVRGWVYGPMVKGYWLDPGRTAVAGNKPSRELRDLVEAGASVTEGLLHAIKPGKTPRELGKLGDELLTAAGDDTEADYWPLYGHGVGKDFYLPPIIPRNGANLLESGSEGVYEEGMAVTVETFLQHKGVGRASFERTALVTADGIEPLDETPMIWW